MHAVQATRPGFDGEKDGFSVEVTETGEGTEQLKSGVTMKKIGQVLQDGRWTPPKSITKVREMGFYSLNASGLTQAKIVSVGPYFSGDLAQRIEVGVDVSSRAS
jgi:hypothetical protein